MYAEQYLSSLPHGPTQQGVEIEPPDNINKTTTPPTHDDQTTNQYDPLPDEPTTPLAVKSCRRRKHQAPSSDVDRRRRRRRRPHLVIAERRRDETRQGQPVSRRYNVVVRHRHLIARLPAQAIDLILGRRAAAFAIATNQPFATPGKKNRGNRCACKQLSRIHDRFTALTKQNRRQH